MRASHGLTDDAIRELKPRAGGRERIVRDRKQPGLLLRCGRRKRTWYLRIEKTPAWNKPLGEWPTVLAEQARRIADEKWKRHRDGRPFEDERVEEPTIETLWPLFEVWLAQEGRSERTIEGYQQCHNRMSEDVRRRPLRELAESPRIMREEQERIRSVLANKQRGGMAMSTAVARYVSSLSNWAVKHDHVRLDGNPVRAAKLVDPKRRDHPALAPEELPAWWAQVQAVKREQHREAHLFTLLSGLRRETVVVMEWKHVDLKRRCVRIGKPKGGEDRGFDLVLSRAMIRCLWRARRIGRRLFHENAEQWVFAGPTGHIRGDGLTKDGLLNEKGQSAANHALRRTYSTLATDAGVDEENIGKMLNHGGKTVTSRYVVNSYLGRLKAAIQEDISRHIVRLLGSPRGMT